MEPLIFICLENYQSTDRTTTTISHPSVITSITSNDITSTTDTETNPGVLPIAHSSDRVTRSQEETENTVLLPTEMADPSNEPENG